MCVLLSFLISGCGNTEEESLMVTLSLSENPKEHYEIQTDGEYVYLVDVKSKDKKLIRQLNESIKEVLKLPVPEKRKWSYSDDGSLPDPNCFSQSNHSPATYNLTLKDAAAYILAMEEAGWELASKQGNYLYLDMYFCKDNMYTRVIILENRMKVFANVSGSLPDTWAYVNQ
jgi:hypothetical protein